MFALVSPAFLNEKATFSIEKMHNIMLKAQQN